MPKLKKPNNTRIMYALYTSGKSKFPIAMFNSVWHAKQSGWWKFMRSRIVRVEISVIDETSYEERRHEYRRI